MRLCTEIILSFVMIFLLAVLHLYCSFLIQSVKANVAALREAEFRYFLEDLLTTIEMQTTQLNNLMAKLEEAERALRRGCWECPGLISDQKYCASKKNDIFQRGHTAWEAFDCKTGEVYWKGYSVWVKRMYLNGTLRKLRISDTPYIHGVAVDSIHCGGQPPKWEVRIGQPGRVHIQRLYLWINCTLKDNRNIFDHGCNRGANGINGEALVCSSMCLSSRDSSTCL